MKKEAIRQKPVTVVDTKAIALYFGILKPT